MASLKEFESAEARARAQLAKFPQARAARYDARSGKVVISFANGFDLAFPAADAQGIENAKAADLKSIDITPSGLGLHFPTLDADIYIPALIEGALGSKRWMAAQLGATGGKARTPSKAAASRRNGRLGGRPRKTAAR